MSLLMWKNYNVSNLRAKFQNHKLDKHISFTAYNSQCHTLFAEKRHLLAPPFTLNGLCKQSQKASFTVEASVVLPICVCALVSVMIFFRILSVQWGINVGSTDIARAIAICGDCLDDGSGRAEITAISHAALSKNDVPTKFVVSGNAGVNFFNSKTDDTDVDVVAEYAVNVPTMMFGRKFFFIGQRVKARRWVGYDPVKEREDDGEYVYITRTGTAYHRDIGCTYLSPSVKATTTIEIESQRNKGGAKYYPCDKCSKSGAVVIYITDYGTVYHSDPTCRFISRSVTRVRLKDLENHHACHKCG